MIVERESFIVLKISLLPGRLRFSLLERDLQDLNSISEEAIR